jgi:hypothetical protein
MSTVIEWAPFRTRPGVDEATLVRLSQQLQTEFLEKQDGYQRRELVKAGDGEYVDIVWWSSMEAAETAMKHVAQSATCNAYFGAMVPEDGEPSVGVKHLHLIHRY